MGGSKIQLSTREREVMKDADLILTKNSIIKKMIVLMGEWQQAKQPMLASSMLPEEVVASGSKISRGENYLGLPYVILDQPRLFGETDQFAVRTMFWWGNFISLTLQLEGKWLDERREQLASAFDKLSARGYYSCIGMDRWQHHFENQHYSSVSELGRHRFSEHMRTRPFVKLARKFDLDDWDGMYQNVLTSAGDLFELLKR